MMNTTKPDNVAVVLFRISMPVMRLGGATVAHKTGLPKKAPVANGIADSRSSLVLKFGHRIIASSFHAIKSFLASAILKGSKSMDLPGLWGRCVSLSLLFVSWARSVLSIVLPICGETNAAPAPIITVSRKSMLKCFVHAAILATITLCCQVSYAAIPDTITDPAIRDAIEYVDGKVDSVMTTVLNSSATLGVPAGILPIIGGGTGAGTDSGARANLGVPSVTGDGATGTWDISITGTVAQTTSLAGGGIGYIPYQSAQNTTSFVAPGTAGYVLTSAGASAPIWTNATHINTASTVVKRDANGDFAAGTVTATAFVGDGAGITGLSLVGGAGVLQLDAEGNLTPDDLVIQDSYLEVVGNDIQPL